MYKNKNILAIIPARGGSKGIKNKNLKKINGKSLVNISIQCLQKVSYVDKIVVSTDSKKISDESKKYGVYTPFKRPKNLSGDLIGDLPVLTHALKQTEKIYKKKYDIVLMIQPTSPNRKPLHIRKVLNTIMNNNYDSVWTVHKISKKYNYLKLLKLKNDNLTLCSNEGKKIIARQQLKDNFIRNGIAYAFTRDCIIKQKTILGKRCGAVITSSKVVNIDSLKDLQEARKLTKI